MKADCGRTDFPWAGLLEQVRLRKDCEVGRDPLQEQGAHVACCQLVGGSDQKSRLVSWAHLHHTGRTRGLGSIVSDDI
jgi:hypothetical protein